MDNSVKIHYHAIIMYVLFTYTTTFVHYTANVGAFF